MRFRVAQPQGLSNAQSPFRVTDGAGREVPWVNHFLDQQRVRSVAETTLRSYAYDLLHFLRWWVSVNHTTAVTEKTLTESALLDYIRFQTNQQPRPPPPVSTAESVPLTAHCGSPFPTHKLPSFPAFSMAIGARSRSASGDHARP